MLKKLLMVVAMSAVTATAFASDEARAAAKQVIELKDGSTVYIFKDGKMGMEDKYGRAMRMKKDTVMEAMFNSRINKMLKKLLMVVAMSAVTATAFAVDAAQVEKSIELKDGSTVYIFKDGKMGMEDKLGRAVRMKKDTVMEAKDGQKIIMHGDEVMRLDSLLHKDHRG